MLTYQYLDIKIYLQYMFNIVIMQLRTLNTNIVVFNYNVAIN